MDADRGNVKASPELSAAGVQINAGRASNARSTPAISPAALRRLQRDFDGMIHALDDEIAAVQRNTKHDAIPVDRGRLVSRDGDEVEYDVSAARSTRGLRAGMQVGYEVEGTIHPAAVLFVRSGAIRLTVRRDLGDITPAGAIVRDTVWLLVALRSAIQELSSELARRTPRGARLYKTARALLGHTRPVSGQRSPHPRVLLGDPLHPDQASAVRWALATQILFLWGPPGTGKTHTLARIIEAHYRAGRRVLVLGPTNDSVDLVMAEVARRLSDEPGMGLGLVLRVGSDMGAKLPRAVRRLVAVGDVADRLIARASGEGSPFTASQISSLEKLRGMLEAEKQDGSRTLRNGIDRCILHHRLVREIAAGRSPRYPELVAVASDLALGTCRIMGTTVTQRYASPKVARQHFDVVVIDEASMVSPAALIAASGTARQVVIAGDWAQLPTVVTSRAVRAHEWLGRDAFSAAGVPEDVARNDSPDHLVMLTEQRRMDEEICEVIAPTYLHRLTTHASVVARGEQESMLPHMPLLWIDTSSLDPRLERVGTSRMNSVHASVVGDLMRYMLLRGSHLPRDLHNVLVLSPFDAQAELLKRAIRSIHPSLRPRCGTVHSTQGDEADIVALDLTDAPPESVSMFLQADRPSQLGGRLLNVGISRARRHVIVVAPFGFLLRNARTGAEVKRILRHFQQHGEQLDIRRIRGDLKRRAAQGAA